jgi:hypothetical protein
MSSHLKLVQPEVPAAAGFGETPRPYYSTVDRAMLTPPPGSIGAPAELLAGLVGLAAFPEGTVIYEGLKDNGELGKDFRPMYLGWIRKKMRLRSLRTKGFLDSTAAIVHTTTDQEIIDTTRRECPLMELIAQETARGKVANYDVLTARANAYFAQESIAGQTPGSDTYVNASKTLGIATAWGGWTDFGLAAMASQYPTRDARAIEIRNKTWSLNETWENEVLNGGTTLESAFNSGGPANIGYNGIRAEIIGSSGTYSQLQANLAGADVTDADIDAMIANMVQLNVKPNLIVTDLITWQKIKQLMITVLRYMNPETEIAWGLKAMAWATPYGVAPIIGSKFMPMTAGSREIIFVDTKFLAQRLLLDSTMEMLAKVSIQQPFVIKKFANSIDKTDSNPPSYTYNTNPSTTNATSKMGRIYNLA